MVSSTVQFQGLEFYGLLLGFSSGFIVKVFSFLGFRAPRFNFQGVRVPGVRVPGVRVSEFCSIAYFKSLDSGFF